MGCGTLSLLWILCLDHGRILLMRRRPLIFGYSTAESPGVPRMNVIGFGFYYTASYLPATFTFEMHVERMALSVLLLISLTTAPFLHMFNLNLEAQHCILGAD